MTDACGEPAPNELVRGVEQFNRGEYLAQHETLEALWRAETRPVRRLYQGLLQIGVAFHHVQRHDYPSAITMLQRGLEHLRPFAPACQQVDVARLVADAERALAALEALGTTRLAGFDWSLAPRVRLLGAARPPRTDRP